MTLKKLMSKAHLWLGRSSGIAFIDQYIGEVLKVNNLRRDFFTFALYLHISLLFPYGEALIGASSLIFLVLLILGWPHNKNRQAETQKFKRKWTAARPPIDQAWNRGGSLGSPNKFLASYQVSLWRAFPFPDPGAIGGKSENLNSRKP